jgi:hypothetical protein
MPEQTGDTGRYRQHSQGASPSRPPCYGGLSGHLHFSFATSFGRRLLAVVMSMAGGGLSLERE